MSLFRVPKPRPFHHEMIYQGRKRHEQGGAHFHFAGMQRKKKTKPVVSREWMIMTFLVLLFLCLFYL